MGTYSGSAMFDMMGYIYDHFDEFRLLQDSSYAMTAMEQRFKKVDRVADGLHERKGEHLQKYDREVFCILNLCTKEQVINMNIVGLETRNISLVIHVRYLSRRSCPTLPALYF